MHPRHGSTSTVGDRTRTGKCLCTVRFAAGARPAPHSRTPPNTHGTWVCCRRPAQRGLAVSLTRGRGPTLSLKLGPALPLAPIVGSQHTCTANSVLPPAVRPSHPPTHVHTMTRHPLPSRHLLRLLLRQHTHICSYNTCHIQHGAVPASPPACATDPAANAHQPRSGMLRATHAAGVAAAAAVL